MKTARSPFSATLEVVDSLENETQKANEMGYVEIFANTDYNFDVALQICDTIKFFETTNFLISLTFMRLCVGALHILQLHF